MTIEYYDAKIPAWEECPLLNRLRDCRALLLLHGVITYRESEIIKQRIHKNLVKQEEADAKLKAQNKPTDD